MAWVDTFRTAFATPSDEVRSVLEQIHTMRLVELAKQNG